MFGHRVRKAIESGQSGGGRRQAARREKLTATWARKRIEQEQRQVAAIEQALYDKITQLAHRQVHAAVTQGLADVHRASISTVGRVVVDEGAVLEVVWDGGL